MRIVWVGAEALPVLPSSLDSSVEMRSSSLRTRLLMSSTALSMGAIASGCLNANQHQWIIWGEQDTHRRESGERVLARAWGDAGDGS